MDAMIPAQLCCEAWRRYEQYCTGRQFDPFCNVALAAWANEISSDSEDDVLVPPEVEIINEILDVARRTG